MDLVEANGLRFRAIDRGAGEPIVILHGFTGSADSWSAITGKLASAYRVIAIDLIGHGHSDAPHDPNRYSFDAALADVAGIIDALHINRATLLGYSMGGRLALGFAVRHPRQVSALILESASPGIADARARAQRGAADAALARRIERDGIPAFVREWERLPLWHSQRSLAPGVLKRQHELRLRNSTHGLANSLCGMGQGAQPSFWDHLGAIQLPVLLIAGSLDAKFAGIAADMAASLPDARMCIVPDAGHAVHLERPPAFAESVTRFLSTL